MGERLRGAATAVGHARRRIIEYASLARQIDRLDLRVAAPKRNCIA